MKLYEYSNEIKKLIDESVNSDTGEISETISQQLDKLYTDKLQKIGDIVLFIKNEDAFIDAIDNEIKKLQEKKKVVKNKTAYLIEYIRRNITEGEKIEQPNYTISWRKSSSIELEDIIDLEEMHERNPELVKKKISFEVDKIRAKEVYKKTGVLPEGLKIIEKNNLQIK